MAYLLEFVFNEVLQGGPKQCDVLSFSQMNHLMMKQEHHESHRNLLGFVILINMHPYLFIWCQVKQQLEQVARLFSLLTLMFDIQTKVVNLDHVLPCCCEVLHLISLDVLHPGDTFIHLELISVISEVVSLRHDNPWPLPIVHCIWHGLIKPKLSFGVLVSQHLFLGKVMLIVEMHLVLHGLTLPEVGLIALVSLLLILLVVLLVVVMIVGVVVLVLLLVVFTLVGLSEVTTTVIIFEVLLLGELSVALTFVLVILNRLVLSEFIPLLSALI